MKTGECKGFNSLGNDKLLESLMQHVQSYPICVGYNNTILLKPLGSRDTELVLSTNVCIILLFVVGGCIN